jgi:hypothetical protein
MRTHLSQQSKVFFLTAHFKAHRGAEGKASLQLCVDLVEEGCLVQWIGPSLAAPLVRPISANLLDGMLRRILTVKRKLF